MCQTCKDAKQYKPGNDSVANNLLRQRLLQEIGAKMKKASPRHFEKALARLTETELAERDEELEGRWENTYRTLRVE